MTFIHTMTVLCYARLTKLRPIFSASAISPAVRLVDHSVPPPRQRRAGIETPHRAEPVAGKAIRPELVDITETSFLATADCARPYGMSRSRRFAVSFDRSRIFSDARIRNRLTAVVASASRSRSVRAVNWPDEGRRRDQLGNATSQGEQQLHSR